MGDEQHPGSDWTLGEVSPRHVTESFPHSAAGLQQPYRRRWGDRGVRRQHRMGEETCGQER